MPPLTSLIAAHDGPFHNYEFFPPRTDAGLVNLLERICRLTSAPLQRPLAVSITWGAGGSTAEKSLELAEQVVKMGVEVVLHLTCTNMAKEKVDLALQKCKDLGIQNILALRGDPPRSEEYAVTPNVPDFFQHADDLVRYIRAEHGAYFCIGVAGYPTAHPDSETDEDEMKWLKVKCDAGADFIVTQLFYDVDGFLAWVKECRAQGIKQTIIPGIMPIQSFGSFRRLVNLTKCPVPSSITSDLQPISSDDAAVKQYGATLATKMVKQILDSGEIHGVHFCTLNLEKSVRTILDNLDWVERDQRDSVSSLDRNRFIESDEDARPSGIPINGKTRSYSNSASLSISPSDASHLAQLGLTSVLPPKSQTHSTATGAPSGPGATGEDSWDEFPNGRFTDVRSPAYGEIDGWGSGLKITAAQALKEWGVPTTLSDLSTLFTSYLQNSPATPTTPFCDLPLSPESQTILPHLLKLNSADKCFWTVGSQPAVDAAKSEDSVVGWGPRGGYVFQKAFVEFFVRPEEVEGLVRKVDELGKSMITLYASNKKGDFKTSTDPSAVNAVTWGVFPGQEIVQSTIIEQESFLAWKEEAFDIWTEWAELYPRQSAARKLLEGVSEEWWLVSLIHHDYKKEDALWKFLLDA
ncbi:methylenetetrahydrofolate reductase [Cryptococcus wingfieldii CBS 7118]|uniref:Methylenetetrahydrofolate reductase n=1 Tax=Cryptococcus wingfieldii CBS 7118 TaxID=1295528 RepID=A0A1E3IE93_9TREE|nr:methylenetetrahydrofolate reductase [Cryptococcus wingfieldii CBS 7118]ODN86071.1 methylenetetrahydrofolate reductase [Cryptococcus wingfieldii CBS 7118]